MTFHIAYACNNNYVEQTLISMISLFQNNTNNNIHIYFIEDNINDDNQKRIISLGEKYGQKIQIESIEHLMGEFYLEGDVYHPRTIYAKLFLDKICQANRILYLDSDTVVRGTLEYLWNIDMQDSYIAGVKMPYSNKIKKELQMNQDESYLCDGVMLFNLEAWRKEKLREKCMNFIRENDSQPYMLSEGTVNYVSEGHIMVLPPEYNFMSSMILWKADQIKQLYQCDSYYTNDELEGAKKKPIIIHYLNELYIRPWYSNSNHPYKKEYIKYRNMAGVKSQMLQGRMEWRTRVLQLLNRYLPFQVFKTIYWCFARKR